MSPKEVDRIELSGTFVNLPGTSDTLDFGGPQVVRDKTRIAEIVSTLQNSEGSWKYNPTEACNCDSDHLAIFLKIDPHKADFTLEINGETVGTEFGPEVKKLYAKYRKRTLEQLYAPQSATSKHVTEP